MTNAKSRRIHQLRNIEPQTSPPIIRWRLGWDCNLFLACQGSESGENPRRSLRSAAAPSAQSPAGDSDLPARRVKSRSIRSTINPPWKRFTAKRRRKGPRVSWAAWGGCTKLTLHSSSMAKAGCGFRRCFRNWPRSPMNSPSSIRCGREPGTTRPRPTKPTAGFARWAFPPPGLGCLTV